MSVKKIPKVESEKKKRFTINVETSDELRKAFRAKVVMNGTTVKEVIEEFMKKYIKK